MTLFIAANFLLPNYPLAQEEALKESSLSSDPSGQGTGASDVELIEQLDPEIQRLKDEIQNYQNSLTELEKQRQVYETSIRAKRQEINNLKNQLGILDESMAKMALEVQAAQLEIEKTNLEIENLKLEIAYKEAETANQKAKMGEVLRTIFKQQRKKSYLEVLVIKGDLGSFFREASELQALEENLHEKLNVINDLKNQLTAKKENIEKRNEQLTELYNKLTANNERLKTDKELRAQLLDSTRGQEADFQQLLAEVKAEQAEINATIMEREVQARRRLLENDGTLPNDDGFIWPIASRAVTAYFHDPDYPYRYVFEHPAVDIGDTPQGTPIRAARSGYVARVKFDGNTNYAYILIVHTGGLSTVYGHISKPYVQEDDFVVQGEVIALSGGLPRTVGAGRLTTGPHLHFEVRLNGIPVDPLKYLP